jgi:truncated hemoglobin YjbI
LSNSPSSPPLPFSILKRIQADLKEADVNGDGRIDFEELKLILSKYPRSFSFSEIEQIGELFYVGRSGQSVRHTTFLRGVQHVLMQQEQQPAKDANPLQLESLDDNRCWVSPPEATVEFTEQLYDIQAQFEQSLLEYVKQVQLLDELGGPEALERVSNVFFQRVVQDETLRRFFVGKDGNNMMERLKRHPYNFMQVAFQLPDNHKSFAKRIQRLHQPLIRDKGLNRGHFDIMMKHFVSTLKDEGSLTQDTIDTATEVLYLFRDCFSSMDEKDGDY